MQRRVSVGRRATSGWRGITRRGGGVSGLSTAAPHAAAPDPGRGGSGDSSDETPASEFWPEEDSGSVTGGGAGRGMAGGQHGGGDFEVGGVGAAAASAAAGSGRSASAESRDGGGIAVECGLQGRLSGGHGGAVLSADGYGSGQPVSVAVPGSGPAHDGGGAAVVYVAVSRVWAAHGDPDRQRAAICVHGARGLESVSRVVGAVRHSSRTDSARHPEREWRP